MWKILVVLLCLAALILLVVMICDSNRFVKVSYRISDRRLKKTAEWFCLQICTTNPTANTMKSCSLR